MLIIGTGGLAKDVAGNISKWPDQWQFVFYNDIPGDTPGLFLDRYRVIRNAEEVTAYFRDENPRFLAAVANPLIRMRLNAKFESLGGRLDSFIFSEDKYISDFVEIGKGSIIQYNVIISSDTVIGEGTFMNCACIIGHDVRIGRYASFGPGVRVLGKVEIGEYSYIGCDAVIMPGVKIGKKVRIGVGKIIDRDIPDNSKIM